MQIRFFFFVFAFDFVLCQSHSPSCKLVLSQTQIKSSIHPSSVFLAQIFFLCMLRFRWIHCTCTYGQTQLNVILLSLLSSSLLLSFAAPPFFSVVRRCSQLDLLFCVLCRFGLLIQLRSAAVLRFTNSRFTQQLLSFIISKIIRNQPGGGVSPVE